MAVRGGGELGSAVARTLFACGIPVAIFERPEPLAVRRRVAFSEAVLTGEALVEGVAGRRTGPADLATRLDEGAGIPVIVDPDAVHLDALGPSAVVDARMTKVDSGSRRRPDRYAVGLGPGFCAGRDVDAVVETSRGPDLGRVVWSGRAATDTGEAAPVAGVTGRVVRAPCEGRFAAERTIGSLVVEGERLGAVAGIPVLAPVSGLLRGLIAEGVRLEAGVKLGDVDPRGSAVDASRISDKGRAVAGGVLEALLALHRGGLR